MSNKLHRIKKVAFLGSMRLALVFDDDRVVVADFSETGERSGLFSRLKDEAYFAKAKTVREGRAIAWPDGLDFCADSLYLERGKRKSGLTTDFMAKLQSPIVNLVGSGSK